MMTTEEKQKIFLNEYAMYGWNIADTYKFICLVGVLYVGFRKKKDDITVYEILISIEPDDNKSYGHLYEITQFHVVGHLYSTHEKFSTFGLKSVADIKLEVKRLLGTWLPF